LIALAQPEITSEDLTSTVSASRLNTFHGCRLRYYFTYIEKREAPSTPSLHIGKSVHEVLRRFNLSRWKGEICSTDELRDAFLTYWSGAQKANPVEWGDDEEAKREQAWKLALTYLENNPVPINEAIEGVEVRLEGQLPGRPTTLVGVLDLIRKGGRVVDYKSSGVTPRDETSVRHSHSLQLSSYSWLYAESTGNAPTAMEIHTLVKLKSPKVVITTLATPNQRQLDRFFRAVDSWADGVGSEDWAASVGIQCAGCPHYSHCVQVGGCR
jgi:CRISPR/Cas system-associated exonuclease Cas4 (RecB family)